ncbi:nucleotide sugar synthetase-like protein [Streptococcus azizii]|uniref:Glucosyltransferase 3 n=1 Tax=Streptococcus azizii TaxID=1579424 RepID=A0AB36JSD6_9STRE|nr:MULTISPECIES: sugar transferase [Streptococcus]MBF0775479.1 sugar transferase [Streptococcus sp. 19428wD3_AN2]ONK28355.1 nucleotide sugar synthetase-like protein [Streptococcus azizii]ONK30194.1 nucleotide sugar synthetase-like protein [Streptococcus azizii]
MRVYITNINGLAGTAAMAQNMVTDIAHSLGYRELGIYCYQMAADSPSELSKRLDGIVAGLHQGDVVIFQTPTWNTTAFDEKVMEKLKMYNIKIIIFIHDVVPLMFAGNFYLMERTISYYNQADLIIAPSQAMVDRLREYGLTVEKTVIQGMWDHPTSITSFPAEFVRTLHFPGDPERFSFVKEWNQEVPLYLYARKAGDLPEQVVYRSYMPDDQLLLELSKGGFGLVWMDDHDKGYQQLYCPHKLGTFLTAGIPVFVQRGIANQEMIEKNRLGFVVDSLEEVVDIIQAMSETEYQQLVAQVRSFNPLLRQGYFTRKLLVNAVFEVLCE